MNLDELSLEIGHVIRQNLKYYDCADDAIEATELCNKLNNIEYAAFENPMLYEAYYIDTLYRLKPDLANVIIPLFLKIRERVDSNKSKVVDKVVDIHVTDVPDIHIVSDEELRRRYGFDDSTDIYFFVVSDDEDLIEHPTVFMKRDYNEGNDAIDKAEELDPSTNRVHNKKNIKE